ncbi:MAG TPA: hypothetical protein VIL85_12300 [Thermomicrobiales bacterium]
MPMIQRVVRLAAVLIQHVATIADPPGLLRRLYAALRHYRQMRRLERLEETLAAEYGPITQEAWARAERIEWPR